MKTATKMLLADRTLIGGKVVLSDGQALSIALEGGRGEAIAKRAASCLLDPMPGDRVLVTLAPEPFVLAVLERVGSGATELAIDGDASLKVRGKLSIDAGEGILLSSRQGVSVLARLFDVAAGEGRLTLQRLTAVAKDAAGSFDAVGLLAKACDVCAERLSSRLQRSYRVVEETESVRARHIDYEAEQTAQLKGETAVVAADGVARIDGAQIHIG